MKYFCACAHTALRWMRDAPITVHWDVIMFSVCLWPLTLHRFAIIVKISHHHQQAYPHVPHFPHTCRDVERERLRNQNLACRPLPNSNAKPNSGTRTFNESCNTLTRRQDTEISLVGSPVAWIWAQSNLDKSPHKVHVLVVPLLRSIRTRQLWMGRENHIGGMKLFSGAFDCTSYKGGTSISIVSLGPNVTRVGYYDWVVFKICCRKWLPCFASLYIKRYQKTDPLIPRDGVTTENVNGSTMPVVKPCVSHCRVASSWTESTKTSSNVVDPIDFGNTLVDGILPTSAIQDVTDQIGGQFTHQLFVKANQLEAC